MAEKLKKGVKLEHISKIYIDPKTQKKFYAVYDTDIEIEPGSFVTLLGPSGCGKTTTLRMIAGFESPDEGDIYLGGEEINFLTPNKRDTAMVFQSYALLPHYNVYDNVAYGIKIKKFPFEHVYTAEERAKNAEYAVTLEAKKKELEVKLAKEVEEAKAKATSTEAKCNKEIANLKAKLEATDFAAQKQAIFDSYVPMLKDNQDEASVKKIKKARKAAMAKVFNKEFAIKQAIETNERLIVEAKEDIVRAEKMSKQKIEEIDIEINKMKNDDKCLVYKHLPKEEIQERVMKMLDLVELTGMEDRMTNQLSGGQQQRVALARALVMEPGVLLFDEPLSNLDAKLRVSMRTEIRKIQQKIGITAIYVTHDQSEAMAISDKIIIMNKGRVAQIGSPTEIYYHPIDKFIADFIGEANFLHAKVLAQSEKGYEVESYGAKLTVNSGSANVGDEVKLVLRPESLHLKDKGDITGEVIVSTFMGSYQLYHVMVNNDVIKITEYNPKGKKTYQIGDKVALDFDESDLHIISTAESVSATVPPIYSSSDLRSLNLDKEIEEMEKSI